MNHTDMHPALKSGPGKSGLLPAQGGKHLCGHRKDGNGCQTHRHTADHQILACICPILGRSPSVRPAKGSSPQSQRQQLQKKCQSLGPSAPAQISHTIPERICGVEPILPGALLRQPASLVEQSQDHHNKQLRKHHPQGKPHSPVHGRKILLQKQIADFLPIVPHEPGEQQSKSQNHHLPQHPCGRCGKLHALPLKISKNAGGQRPQQNNRRQKHNDIGAVAHPKDPLRRLSAEKQQQKAAHQSQKSMEHQGSAAHSGSIFILSLVPPAPQQFSQSLRKTSSHGAPQKSADLHPYSHVSHAAVPCCLSRRPQGCQQQNICNFSRLSPLNLCPIHLTSLRRLLFVPLHPNPW